MKLKLFFFPLILFLLTFCLPPLQTIQAAKPFDIVINEIAWMGTKVEGIESKNWWRYEWLELYNNTSSAISLNDWKIELYRTGLDFTIELKGETPAQGYFLIVASDKVFSNYDLNYSNLGGKFNNNGQKVILKDNLGNIIDEIDCFSSKKWFAGDNNTKQTMERKNPQISENNPENWQSSQNPGGTPKTKNSSEANIISQSPEKTDTAESSKTVEPLSEFLPGSSQIVYPSGIIINEILPSPTGSDEKEEWVEIFNQNNSDIDLSGWKIKDTSGKITAYSFPKETKISFQGFLVLSREKTKITLNNDQDGLILTSPDGKIIDEVNYKKAPQGKSYNRFNSDWLWSANLTPGASNVTEKIGTQSPEGKSTSETKEKIELAAIGEQITKSSKSLFILLIALGTAISSGIIILILKKRVKNRI